MAEAIGRKIEIKIKNFIFSKKLDVVGLKILKLEVEIYWTLKIGQAFKISSDLTR